MHSFENLYIKVRDSEQRLLADEEVKMLPFTPLNSDHREEWFMRNKSLLELKKIISKKKVKNRILDLGCGNGWMSHHLTNVAQEVIGIDINSEEINQAKRVFNHPLLTFKCIDIFTKPQMGRFDCIVISAVLQYFEHPKDLFNLLKENYLNPDGKIIVMDTFFYQNSEIESAKKRSTSYYKSIGFEEMSEYYFHHSEEIFSEFDTEIVSSPRWWELSFLKKWIKPSPFKIYSISF